MKNNRLSNMKRILHTSKMGKSTASILLGDGTVIGFGQSDVIWGVAHLANYVQVCGLWGTAVWSPLTDPKIRVFFSVGCFVRDPPCSVPQGRFKTVVVLQYSLRRLSDSNPALATEISASFSRSQFLIFRPSYAPITSNFRLFW